MTTKPEVRGLYDQLTSTFSYVVWDPESRDAAIVDPVLDHDGAAGRTGTHSAAALLAIVAQEGLRLRWILESHAHADHLSAAGFLLFADGERLPLGGMEVEVIATPGHTSDSVTYRVGDAAFVGDTLFAPDYGSARCDFPGGDAATLFRSVQRLYALPADTRLFLCHDYPPDGRAPRCEWSVAEMHASNIHINEGTREADFVAMRRARDAELKMSALIIPSVQVNIRAGRLPEPEDNGRRYLRVPLDVLGVER